MPRKALWVTVTVSSDISRPLTLPDAKRAASRPTLLAQLRRDLFAHHADAAAAGAPDVDAHEQEQPHNVDEMPVPRGELEAEVLGRREMPGIGAGQADDQEDGADQHMEAVEAGRHKEGRAVDVVGEVEQRVAVLIGLHAGE